MVFLFFNPLKSSVFSLKKNFFEKVQLLRNNTLAVAFNRWFFIGYWI
jgi:hypothetical protein